MEKLAIFGGSPVRDKEHRIFYGKQCVEQDDVDEVVKTLADAVVKTLLSPLITCGPKVQELEEMLCDITKAKHSVVVSNGTAALHIACMAIGIKPGDEVIVSAITFAASANCVLYCGGTPVFADIRPDTYNIDVEDVKRKITPNTKAIVAVDDIGAGIGEYVLVSNKLMYFSYNHLSKK